MDTQDNQRIHMLTKTISLALIITSMIVRIFLPNLNITIDSLFWLFSFGAILFVIFDACLSPIWHIRNLFLTISIVCFICVSFFSSIWAVDAKASMLQSTIWLNDIFLFFSICYWGRDFIVWKILFAVILACFMTEAIFSIYQYFLDLPATRIVLKLNPELLKEINTRHIGLFKGRLNSSQAFGHFIISTSLGAYIVLHLITFCFFIKKSTFPLWFKVLLITIALIAFWTCKSKGSLLSILFVGVLIVICANKKKKRVLIASSYLIVSVCVLFSGIFTGSLDFIGHKTITLLMRTEYWLAATDMFSWHGVGVNNFPHYYYSYKSIWAEEVNNAHNFYLQWCVETGILGIAALLMLWASIAKTLSKTTENLSNLKTTSLPKSFALWASLPAFFLIWWLQSSFQAGYIVQVYFKAKVSPENLVFIENISYHIITVAFIGVWYFFFALFYKQTFTKLIWPIKWSLLAFAIHCFLDINFYVPCLSQYFWIFLALLVCSCPYTLKWHVPLMFRGLLLLLFLIITMVLCTSIVPKIQNIEKTKTNVTHMRKELYQSKNYQKTFVSYHNFLQNSLKKYPLNAKLNLEMAMLLLEHTQMTAKNFRATTKNILWTKKMLTNATKSLQQSLSNGSHAIGILHASAQFFSIEAKIWKKLRQKSMYIKALKNAKLYIDKAILKYPYNSHFLLFAGDIYKKLKYLEKSMMFYQKSLYCTDMLFLTNYGLTNQERELAITEIIYLRKKINKK